MCKLFVALSLIVCGCGTVAPSPSVQLTAAPSVVAPSIGPVGSASPSAALASCERSQVRMTPGATGGAAGTSYLTVFVELEQGPPCALPWGPLIEVRDADGDVIVSATEAEAKPVALTYITRYYIGWSSDCRPIPSGNLVAHIDFSATLAVDMPIGSFRPS